MPAAVRTKKFAPKPADPQADPRFKSVRNNVGQKAAELKKHPPAKLKSSEAAQAAKGPPNEKAAGAKSKQVDTLKETKAEAPPADSFLTVLRAEIAKVMPSNNEEAKDFMEDGAESAMKGAVGGNVKDQKEAASGDMQKASAKPPNEGGVPVKAVEAVPPDPSVAPPPVNGAAGMPAPKPEADITEKQTKADAQTALKENRLEGKRLQNKDPRFERVKSEKGNVDKTADAAPGQYRAAEKQVLGKASAQANVTARTGMSALTTVKNKSKSAVKSRQDAQKAKDEARRKAVTDRIEAIYTETKIKVDTNLGALERDVMAIFDPGCSSAIAALKANIDREVEKFFDARYSGLSGAAQWVVDKFKDTPPEVKEITRRNVQLFTKEMDALAVRVAGLVDKRLNKAKSDIDAGQTKIKAFVAGLPKDLQAVGKEAETAMESRFNEMRDGVESKKNELAAKLAEKYKEAHDQANAYAKKVEEENAGAFKKLADAIGEVIKIIMEFKDKLLALLRKAADAIELMLDDPIGFLGNLIGAVKLGVNQFVNNIWTHLKAGFMKWLFGALADAGIEIPTDLSLVSIFKLVMGVLGITYPRMRAKAVKLLGPTAVAVIEKLIEYVAALITGGPAKLWEQVKSDIGDLKSMVIDAIQNWLIETVVKQAAIKLLSFFNPAGAFVQAVIAIYNTVVFIVENASRIMAFVEAVINSVSSIAKGAIGAAANWIEQSLASIIPLVIGFLARLIGLGGISKKVKEFIDKVQTKVDQAIDKAIAKLVAVVRKLFGRGGAKAGGKGADAKGTDTADEPFSFGTESHTLRLSYKDGKVVYLMASGSFGALNGKLDEISKTYAQPFRDFGLPKPADDIDKKINVIRNKMKKAEKDSDKKLSKIDDMGRRHTAMTKDVHEAGLVLQDGLRKLAEQLTSGSLGKQLFGKAAKLKLKDNVLFMNPPTALQVTEIKKFGEVGGKQELYFKAESADGSFKMVLLYREEGVKWQLANKPHFKPFAPGGPGGVNRITIDKANLNSGSPASHTPGWFGKTLAGRLFAARGHLIARVLGGPGGANNIVPLTTKANNQMEHSIEVPIAKDIKKNDSVYDYTAQAHYPGGNTSQPPDSVTVTETKIYPNKKPSSKSHNVKNS